MANVVSPPCFSSVDCFFSIHSDQAILFNSEINIYFESDIIDKQRCIIDKQRLLVRTPKSKIFRFVLLL